MKKQLSYLQLIKDIRKLGACSLAMLASSPVVLAQDAATNAETVREEVVVTGIRQSLANAAAMKRDASEIVDAISAEDIGKLSDSNVAEALQRVTGLTIGRDDAGDGTSFQIRGFGGNALTINGKAVVTDGFDARQNNLNALSSGIVKNITVKKSQSADDIEGGIGGSVDIELFSPLDFKEDQLKFNGEIIDNSIDSDPAPRFTALASKNWDLPNGGGFGALINIEHEQKNQVSEQYEGRTRGLTQYGKRPIQLLGLIQTEFDPETGEPDPRYLPPTDPNFYEEDFGYLVGEGDFKGFDLGIERTALSTTLEFQPNDRLNFKLSGQVSEREENRDEDRIRIQLGNGLLSVIPGTQDWHTGSRAANPTFEFDGAAATDDKRITGNGVPVGEFYRDLPSRTEPFQYSLLTKGTFLAQNNNGSGLRSQNGFRVNEKSSLDFAFDVEWKITDNLIMEASYAVSESETDNTGYGMQMTMWGLDPVNNDANGNPLVIAPSFDFDMNSGGDIPIWRHRWLDPDQKKVATPIADYNPDITSKDFLYNNMELNNAGKGISRTRGYIDALAADFDWDVNFGVINQIEFGFRFDQLENFKNRSDFVKTINNTRGNGLGQLRGADSIQGERRTLQNIVDHGLFYNISDADGNDNFVQASSLNNGIIDDFFELNTALSETKGTFPRSFWGGGSDAGKWDNFINSIYGGVDVQLNVLQTEKLEEDRQAFYAKFNFETEIGNVPITGNFGARYVKTEANSQAYIAHCNVPWKRADNQSLDNPDIAGIDHARYSDAFATFRNKIGQNQVPNTIAKQAELLAAVADTWPAGAGPAPASFDPTNPDVFGIKAVDGDGNPLLNQGGEEYFVFPETVLSAWNDQMNALNALRCRSTPLEKGEILNTAPGQIAILNGQPLQGGRVPFFFDPAYVPASNRKNVKLTLTTGTEGALPGQILNKDYVESITEYDAWLPSLNVTAQVQEDMYVRVALYRAMTRPDPNDLSLDPANRGTHFEQGNPDLEPEFSDSFDLSWEWYPSDTSSLSAAYFHKSLKNTLVFSTEFNQSLNRFVKQPINVDDGGTVDGVELAATHLFESLPGFWGGFGASANITLIDSEQSRAYDEVLGSVLPIANRSDSAYNLQLFYEKYNWSVRLAYNWRDISLNGGQDGAYRTTEIAQRDDDFTALFGEDAYLGRSDLNARIWNDDYAQLDFSVSYEISDSLSVGFKANNLTKEVSRQYSILDFNTRRYNLAATIYRLGVTWSLN